MGVDTNNHAIMKELERVKSYMAKVKYHETKGEKEAQKKVIDKEAAARFIKASLGQKASEPESAGSESDKKPEPKPTGNKRKSSDKKSNKRKKRKDTGN